jgi:hypothetical protein
LKFKEIRYHAIRPGQNMVRRKGGRELGAKTESWPQPRMLLGWILGIIQDHCVTKGELLKRRYPTGAL